MQEEGNLTCRLELITISPFENAEEKNIAHVFTTMEEIHVNKFQPELSEVQYFQAFSIKEGQKLITENPENFAPSFRVHFKRFIEKLKK